MNKTAVTSPDLRKSLKEDILMHKQFVKLLHDVGYPEPWVPGVLYKKGEIVPVRPAYNQPLWESLHKVFIDTPEMEDNPYGILLYEEDYCNPGQQQIIPNSRELARELIAELGENIPY